jgi:glycosyltransferase involved in cell wall biosynthesis
MAVGSQSHALSERRAHVSALVSLVIPSYNRPTKLPLAVKSALYQSYENLEVIVHDNGSDVDPRDVLSLFKDSRLKIYRNETNLGVSTNFAMGLARSTGDYVGIVADDDFLAPDFVEKLAAPLDRYPDVAVSFSAFQCMVNGVPDEPLTGEKSRYFGLNSLQAGVHTDVEMLALVVRCISMVTGSLLRRTAAPWSEIPEMVGIGTDVYMMYLLARTKKHCFYTKERLAFVSYDEDTLTTKMTSTPQARINSAGGALRYWKLIHDDEALAYRDYYRIKMVHCTAIILLNLIKVGQWRGAMATLSKGAEIGMFTFGTMFKHLSYLYRLRQGGVIRRMMP